MLNVTITGTPINRPKQDETGDVDSPAPPSQTGDQETKLQADNPTPTRGPEYGYPITRLMPECGYPCVATVIQTHTRGKHGHIQYSIIR